MKEKYIDHNGHIVYNRKNKGGIFVLTWGEFFYLISFSGIIALIFIIYPIVMAIVAIVGTAKMKKMEISEEIKERIKGDKAIKILTIAGIVIPLLYFSISYAREMSVVISLRQYLGDVPSAGALSGAITRSLGLFVGLMSTKFVIRNKRIKEAFLKENSVSKEP